MSAKKLLLVDANIISHALTPNQTSAYVKLFTELERDYQFIVTGYTKYEVTCSSDKEHREKIEAFIEQTMLYVNLSESLMDFAARLHYLYSKHASTKGHHIGMGDIVNAAFAIAKPCEVLTIDNNDYPTLFFAELKRKRVKYTSKKGNSMTDTVCILAPDIENTKECFDKYEV